MNRLTKKDYKGWKQYSGYYNKKKAKCITEIKHKLGKLEDIEEELGCPLEVVFKGMSDYVVEYKIKDEIVPGLISSVYKGVSGKWFGDFIPKRYIFGKRDYYVKTIELNQYLKSWWLKGEKENE